MNNLSKERILELALKAQKAAENAYAPYSHFRVGAVAIDDQGREFTGCNVETPHILRGFVAKI
jgi:cytidine deaminase